MNESLKQVLMRRDKMTPDEADEAIGYAVEELRRRLDTGEDVWDLCEEEFGLEPDYLEELMACVY